MTPGEAVTILAMAAAYDGRMRVTNRDEIRIQAEAWAAALDEHITYDDARALVIEHYAHSRDVLMPTDINTAWWRKRREIMRTHVDPIPEADPDDVTAWLAELRANRAAHGYDPTKYGQKWDPDDRTCHPKVARAITEVTDATRLNQPDDAA